MTTRDEVLAMAIRDVCELEPADPDSENTVSVSVADLRVILERFHALAVAKERGECAKVAETPVSGEQDDITRQACDGIAKRIRARSAK